MATPPSLVLCMKIHDMDENELLNALHPYGGLDLPIFVQRKKQLAFVQFPSLDAARHCLNFVKNGELVTQQGKAVCAEFSSRKEVTVEGNVDRQQGTKRPRDSHPMVHDSTLKKSNTLHNGSGLQMGGGGGGGNEEASPVLCVKADLEEAELLRFVNNLSPRLPRPVDILWMHQKNMAFVQYTDVRQSTMILNHFKQNDYRSPSGHAISAAYSKRQSIERTDRKPQGDESQANARPEAPPSKVIMATLRPHSKEHVRLTVEDVLYPFMRFGIVNKIVTFGKKDKSDVQVLVQYENQQFAQLARERMNNTIIGNFRAYVRFSDNEELEIQNNNDRSRDFTNPWLGEETSAPQNAI
eukprot:GEMP01053979.1.p1 GENE.GEMP01053979.1~~GEMP01053979.1.p1  ORF type:complete len:354 (+),score=93.67 GEMP01053979.1:105-1166(+)